MLTFSLLVTPALHGHETQIVETLQARRGFKKVVLQGGIEPPTRGFSDLG
jgi:hypothetical protein